VLEALTTIAKDNWQWRKQIWRLALFELRKQTKGSALGWFWIFGRYFILIFAYWFALEVGLRAGRDLDGPFLIWLLSGLIPWFFMRTMISAGSGVLNKFSFLVQKIKFPISGISTLFSVSSVLIHLGLVGLLLIIGIPFSGTISIYLLQVPLIILLMLFFFTVFSVLTSQISAISKDFALLLKSFATPLFWFSGVIFNVKGLGIAWLETMLLFNPITFFCSSFRAAFFYQTWFWEDLPALGGMAIVFVGTFVLMVFIYSRLHEVVADGL